MGRKRGPQRGSTSQSVTDRDDSDDASSPAGRQLTPQMRRAKHSARQREHRDTLRSRFTRLQGIVAPDAGPVPRAELLDRTFAYIEALQREAADARRDAATTSSASTRESDQRDTRARRRRSGTQSAPIATEAPSEGSGSSGTPHIAASDAGAHLAALSSTSTSDRTQPAPAGSRRRRSHVSMRTIGGEDEDGDGVSDAVARPTAPRSSDVDMDAEEGALAVPISHRTRKRARMDVGSSEQAGPLSVEAHSAPTRKDSPRLVPPLASMKRLDTFAGLQMVYNVDTLAMASAQASLETASRESSRTTSSSNAVVEGHSGRVGSARGRRGVRSIDGEPSYQDDRAAREDVLTPLTVPSRSYAQPSSRSDMSEPLSRAPAAGSTGSARVMSESVHASGSSSSGQDAWQRAGESSLSSLASSTNPGALSPHFATVTAHYIQARGVAPPRVQRAMSTIEMETASVLTSFAAQPSQPAYAGGIPALTTQPSWGMHASSMYMPTQAFHASSSVAVPWLMPMLPPPPRRGGGASPAHTPGARPAIQVFTGSVPRVYVPESATRAAAFGGGADAQRIHLATGTAATVHTTTTTTIQPLKTATDGDL